MTEPNEQKIIRKQYSAQGGKIGGRAKGTCKKRGDSSYYSDIAKKKKKKMHVFTCPIHGSILYANKKIKTCFHCQFEQQKKEFEFQLQQQQAQFELQLKMDKEKQNQDGK